MQSLRRSRYSKQAFGRRWAVGRARALLTHPLFWFLSLLGNGVMAAAATALYFLEYGTNPRIIGFVDALWWAMATVTTVGYGDVLPVTFTGTIIGMGLMILGTAVFGSFTALFATILLEPEIEEVEAEVRSLEKRLEP